VRRTASTALTVVALVGSVAGALTGCSGGTSPAATRSSNAMAGMDTSNPPSSSSALPPPALPGPPPPSAPRAAVVGFPGMPPVPDPANVYAAAGAGMLGPAAKAARPMVYVPHNSGSVWEIDPATFAVVARFPAGKEVQHVVPSWDMRTLYATDDVGNTVTPIDPTTGADGPRIPVEDPYNMYSTPDGTAAISVAEAHKSLVFYDPHTWAVQGRLALPDCAGVDHMDYTADGRLGVFTCEFAGRVAVVDMATRALVRTIDMPVRHTHMGPQDIKLSPDGSRFYVADSDQGSLWVLDGAATEVIGEIRTGRGTHGIYVSRDAKELYVTDREDNSVSVLAADTGAPVAVWTIPNSSPDMGGVTADGSQLWLSGRYSKEVYVLSTADGHLLARIPVADGPHGLCVWPQPGRYSIGHTGITR
jgi:DNA-binding beta-propeller fold protein YncE